MHYGNACTARSSPHGMRHRWSPPVGRATRKYAAGIQTEAGLRVAAPPAPPAASRAGEVRHGLSKGGGRASRQGGAAAAPEWRRASLPPLLKARHHVWGRYQAERSAGTEAVTGRAGWAAAHLGRPGVAFIALQVACNVDVSQAYPAGAHRPPGRHRLAGLALRRGRLVRRAAVPIAGRAQEPVFYLRCSAAVGSRPGAKGAAPCEPL